MFLIIRDSGVGFEGTARCFDVTKISHKDIKIQSHPVTLGTDSPSNFKQEISEI